MLKTRITALVIFLLGGFLGFFVYTSESSEENAFSRFPFKLGLDLAGGTQLVYRADVSQIDPTELKDSMEALRDVIERRVNLFGVGEPLVQVETTSGLISSGKENRLIVELPGVTDLNQAIAMIGQTPLLEFRLEIPDGPRKTALLERIEVFEKEIEAGGVIPPEALADADALYQQTKLTGRFLTRSSLEFDATTREPRVVLNFNSEGSDLFAKITRENVGKRLAIYLDGAPISIPVIREEITGGQAEISGGFTPVDAKLLVGRLNSGALPVPIELLSSQTIGPSLGAATLVAGVRAGIAGLIAVVAFLIFWYRVPGLVAAVALGIYALMNLALFKLVGVTLTAAGIAGFILSIGMAVDGNILIFERMKEELRAGKKLRDAIHDGFDRAWTAIWDGNVTAIISAVILFWFGTSLVEGFAFTFGLGVLLSMVSSITVTRVILNAVSPEEAGATSSFLFKSGISK